MTLDEIREVFGQHADAERGERDKKYMRNLFPHYGVRASERDKLFKPLWDSKTDPLDWQLVFDLWNEDMREMQYIAVWYLHTRKDQLTKSDIPNLKKLAQTKQWWDTIDGMCGLFGDLAQNDESVKQTMLEWSTDDDFWIRRIAIQHQLHLRDKTDTELLAKTIKNNFGEKERSSPSTDGLNQEQNRAFFINKSIGWVLREYAKTNPGWVRKFIDENKDRMAKLSVREASKHLGKK
ncbi:DNA alkylation repair protein [Candidatus Saccharibacteria bacterium]|nr:DNA alkylation repair protein [Candidatus Saccharibacteria bacterium]